MVAILSLIYITYYNTKGATMPVFGFIIYCVPRTYFQEIAAFIPVAYAQEGATCDAPLPGPGSNIR
jgi:hypothetical protein